MAQFSQSDLCKSHVDQCHEPRAFLSRCVTGTQLPWPTLEKEAFAIMEAVNRMHCVLATSEGFDLLTDHYNIKFLFVPLAIVPDLLQTSIQKVLRWAVKLCSNNYIYVHFKGVEKVQANIIDRWSSSVAIRCLALIPALPPSSSSKFEWTSSAALAQPRSSNANSRPKNRFVHDDLWCNSA